MAVVKMRDAAADGGVSVSTVPSRTGQRLYDILKGDYAYQKG